MDPIEGKLFHKMQYGIKCLIVAKKEQFIFEPCENFYLSYPPLNSGPSSDVVAKLSKWRESAEAAHAGGELVGGGAGGGGAGCALAARVERQLVGTALVAQHQRERERDCRGGWF